MALTTLTFQVYLIVNNNNNNNYYSNNITYILMRQTVTLIL